MQTNIRKSRRSQLDHFFSESAPILNLKKPSGGWIQEIRKSLGMSLEDLGRRLGTNKARIHQIEKSEVLGKVTMETMAKTAEAMNCKFIYFVVPESSLEQILSDQVRLTAAQMLQATNQTMMLEDQKVSGDALKKIFQPIEEELLRTHDRRIWKTKK